MKKIIIGFLSAAAVAVGLSSCDLDAVVYSEMTEVNYPKTEADAQSLLDGMYGYLKTNSGSVNMSSTANTGWGWPYWSIGQIGYFGFNLYTTDECRYSSPGNDIADFKWGLNSEDWMQTFQIIKNASRLTQIIYAIENTPGITEAKKNQMVAEAKALRGMTMYVFHDLFGTFHVTLDPKELDNITYQERPSEEEYYGWMVKDFTEAIPYLYDMTNNTSDWGRLNKATAYMFLAKLAMRKGDYSAAKGYLEEIVKMGCYHLADDYFLPFSEEGEQDAENIYCIPSGTKADNEFYFYTTPGNCQAMLNVNKTHTGGTGEFVTTHYWGGTRPTWDLYDAFEENDIRRGGLSDRFLSLDKDKDGNYITYTRENPGSSVLQFGCLSCKYFYSQDRAYSGNIHSVVFRYADVLMMLAECDVKINNAVTKNALDLVKQVAGRAGTEVPDEATKSVDAFMKYFKQERFREFYLEGWRRDDLLRWGDFVETARKRNASASDMNKLMPIPARVVNESHDIIKQNPGYSD